ncbi:hypothetical protein N9J72_00240 [Candidatus Gracilibacteria bacterium]|nr:hypothetical protein [Candidatus Gracilibacteria bacterium]
MPELDYKQILGAITVLMIIVGYGKYMIDTWKGKTTPHLFSWIIFFPLGVISFLIQYNDGAGPGAWGTAGGFVTAGIIVVLSLKQGEKNITKTDTISFVLGLCAVGLYIFVSNPVYALVLLIIINVFAFYPTFRKTYHKPNEETLLAYVLAGIRSSISIGAMANYSFLTLAMPIFIVMVNIAFVTLVLVRKKQLNK